jgi:hypothetical protein
MIFSQCGNRRLQSDAMGRWCTPPSGEKAWKKQQKATSGSVRFHSFLGSARAKWLARSRSNFKKRARSGAKRANSLKHLVLFPMQLEARHFLARPLDGGSRRTILFFGFFRWRMRPRLPSRPLTRKLSPEVDEEDIIRATSCLLKGSEEQDRTKSNYSSSSDRPMSDGAPGRNFLTFLQH